MSRLHDDIYYNVYKFTRAWLRTQILVTCLSTFISNLISASSSCTQHRHNLSSAAAATNTRNHDDKHHKHNSNNSVGLTDGWDDSGPPSQRTPWLTAEMIVGLPDNVHPDRWLRWQWPSLTTYTLTDGGDDSGPPWQRTPWLTAEMIVGLPHNVHPDRWRRW